jgi:mRNA-degrading endonuclease toxin of MazEF toxin-antitoxin module
MAADSTRGGPTDGGSRRGLSAVTEPRRGEVWFVFTPGRPKDPHQPRPALVISEDVRNSLRDHLVVVPIFTSGRLGPTRVALQAGAGGVPHDCVLFCEELTTIDRDFLAEGPLGPRVSRQTLIRVAHAVRRALGDVVPDE